MDARYINGLGFLAPYYGTRYHLNEWFRNTPQTYKELFNLRHASAQNKIERSFGILKKMVEHIKNSFSFLYKDTNKDYQCLFYVTQLHQK